MSKPSDQDGVLTVRLPGTNTGSAIALLFMINVVNKPKRCTNSQVNAMMQAVTHQLRYDAAPLRGQGAGRVEA